jgi:hypothetical protein
MPGKRIQFDDESWAVVDLLARDRMMTFQELAEEAFRDLLRKHNRPIDLKDALRKSAGASGQLVPFRKAKKARKTKKKPAKNKEKRAKSRL